MNINILQNGVNLLEKDVSTSKEKNLISSDVKNYIGFCSTLGLKQLIKVSTRITSNNSTLIDHIITSSSEKVVQAGIIETSLSDHQLVFCTRKVKRAKPNKHNYLTFHSMKNFSMKLSRKFWVIWHFGCVKKAYSDLTSKRFDVVNKVAPTKAIRVNDNTSEWFDGETTEKIDTRGKLFRKFKNFKLSMDDILYKGDRNTVQVLIKDKKRKFLQEKLS